MVLRSKLLGVSVFLFLLVSVTVPSVSATNDDAVPLEVIEAEEALVSAYEVVSEAEASGVNVSALINELNVGSEYLGEAHVSVHLDDSENISYFAGLCYNIAKDVQSDAVELRDEAKRSRMNESIVVMFGSVIGVIAVMVLAFVGDSTMSSLFI